MTKSDLRKEINNIVSILMVTKFKDAHDPDRPHYILNINNMFECRFYSMHDLRSDVISELHMDIHNHERTDWYKTHKGFPPNISTSTNVCFGKRAITTYFTESIISFLKMNGIKLEDI